MIFKFEQLQGGNYEKIGEDLDAFLGRQERLRMDCEKNFKMLFWWMDDWFLPRGWFVKRFLDNVVSDWKLGLCLGDGW